MGGYFGNVGAMIVGAIFGLMLFVAVMRVLLPLSGARFRNPICQFIYKTANPIVAPLGKLIPNVRNVSVAAILVAWLVAVLAALLLLGLLGLPVTPLSVLVFGTATLVQFTLTLYFWSIIVYALMSFVSPDYGNPVVELLTDFTAPILKPFRKLPPRMQGLDLSPLWACLTLRIVMYTLAYFGFVGLLS